MTLRRKLLLSLLFTVLPLVALGLTAHEFARSSLLDDAQRSVERRTQLLADDLGSRIDIARAELDAIAGWPELTGPVLDGTALGDPSTIAGPFAAVQTWWGGFEELAIVTRGGRVLAVSDPTDASLTSVESFSASDIGVPVLVDGSWKIYLEHPIDSRADAPAVVVARIDSSFLVEAGLVPVDAVAEIGGTDPGAVFAVFEEGLAIVFVDDATPPARAAEIASTADFDRDVSAVVAVDGTDLRVVALDDRSEVLQPLRRLRWAIAGAVVVALASAIALAALLGRTISARIGKLRALTAAIGEGDLTSRSDDSATDELGELSASVDRMAEQLATDNQRRIQIEDELSHQALHDPLTGLANRIKFLDRLGDALARSSRSGAPVAVLFCDLDNLKIVNDRFGHTAGDDLLTGVADRFRTSVRPSDTVARFGGDEFVVLCAEMAAPEDALVVADRLSAALLQPFDIDDEEVFASASIGIAVGSGATATVEDLVRDADSAMYDAKQHGKAHYVVHSSSLRDRSELRKTRADEVRAALATDQLRIEYQPVLELETGRLDHVEALVRWDHPDRGVLGPADILSQFASAGAMLELDNWVLDAALRQLASWNDARVEHPPVHLTVNLARESVQSDDAHDRLDDALTRHGIDASQLRVEISEPTLADDPGAAAASLDLIRELGVGLVLDDFGTGHTSVERLRRYHFEMMKIDGSLIDRIDRSEDHSSVMAALSLATALDMDTVAEGVERLEQVPELLRLGCRFAQGHLFCAPIGEVGLAPWLDRMEL